MDQHKHSINYCASGTYRLICKHVGFLFRSLHSFPSPPFPGIIYFLWKEICFLGKRTVLSKHWGLCIVISTSQSVCGRSAHVDGSGRGGVEFVAIGILVDAWFHLWAKMRRKGAFSATRTLSWAVPRWKRHIITVCSWEGAVFPVLMVSVVMICVVCYSDELFVAPVIFDCDDWQLHWIAFVVCTRGIKNICVFLFSMKTFVFHDGTHCAWFCHVSYHLWLEMQMIMQEMSLASVFLSCGLLSQFSGLEHILTLLR